MTDTDTDLEPGTAPRSTMAAPSGRPENRAARIVLRTLSLLVLSAALPALLLGEMADVGRSEAWVVTLVIMIWAGVRLSLLWVRGTPRLFDFFFWLFVYIFLGIAPTVQIRSGLISTTTPGVDGWFDLPTAGVVALGLACYEIGRLAWVVVEHYRPAGRSAAVRTVSSRRTWILLAGATLLAAYVLSRLGATIFLGSREAAGAAREAAWPDPAVRSVIFASGVYPLLVSIGAVVQLRRGDQVSAVARRWMKAIALGCAAILLLIVNPIASARYSFGTVAFALVVFAGAVATRQRARLTMLATIGGFLFVFPLADAFRRVETGTRSRTDFFGEYPSNPDYDAFWQIANALSYWIDGLVEPFNQFLGSVLFWVPRALWPDKPEGTGVVLAAYRGYSFDNLSAPMWAEALVNGGVVAVVLTFLALGVGLRAMDTRIVPALATGGVWAIAGAVLPVYMTILLRGSLLQATGALALMIGCLILVRGPRSDVGPPTSSAGAATPTALGPPFQARTDLQ